jgi:hypothetical protein
MSSAITTATNSPLTHLLASQTADLCRRSPQIAQVPVPSAQVPVPSAQVPVPSAQVPFPTAQAPVPTAKEALNLSPSPDPSLDTNAFPPTTSDSPPQKTTSPLEPSTRNRSASEGRGHGDAEPNRGLHESRGCRRQVLTRRRGDRGENKTPRARRAPRG